MKRSLTILFIVLTLALVQLACSLPGVSLSGDGTPGTTVPISITATPRPNPDPINTRPVTTATSTIRVTATWMAAPANTGQGGAACTYRATFLRDATIPDDTVVEAGSIFVKTWMVRNDGTCTWGPNGYALHALAFIGGIQMGAPSVIPLYANVSPGETADVSVTLTAPSAPGTYTSNWMFRVDNDPNSAGPNLGLGPNGDQPLYVRIRVGGESDGLTRLQFQPGTTTAIVTGSLGANETRGYLVAAQHGQVIIAGTPLGDWENGVRVKISTSDNIPLPDLVDNLNVVVSLPETRDYTVWVTGGSNATSYRLAVTIPICITFDSSENSTSLDGSINNGREILYMLRASAGQILSASLDGSNVSLIITALENPQVLTNSASDKIVTSWTGTLPATQDYLIQVMPAAESIQYTLHVTVQ